MLRCGTTFISFMQYEHSLSLCPSRLFFSRDSNIRNESEPKLRGSSTQRIQMNSIRIFVFFFLVLLTIFFISSEGHFNLKLQALEKIERNFILHFYVGSALRFFIPFHFLFI